jgi:glycosyltransferase involved in cell wall biosynthesis
LSSGGNILQFAVLDEMRKYVKITLALPCGSEYDFKRIQKLKGKFPDINIKTLQPFFSSKHKNLKNRIIFSLIAVNNCFLKLKAYLDSVRIRSESESTAEKTRTDFDNFHFVNIGILKNRKFINRINTIINDGSFDLVQIDFIDYLDIVHALPKNLKKVLVHHEIRFARLESSLIDVPNASLIYENYVISNVKMHEINQLKFYDGVIVVSNIDKAKLQKYMPDSRICCIKAPVLEDNIINIEKINLLIEKLVFVGGENHSPNREAIEWYITELGDRINQFSKLKLHVIGDWSKKSIDKYKIHKNVHFVGFVDDLFNYCKKSIMLVPIKTGSGIRMKILYAMAQGVPVVSTSVGCEGIDVTDGVELLIANKAEGFVQSIAKICSDLDFTYNMVSKAQKFIKENYSQKSTVKQRVHFYGEILSS